MGNPREVRLISLHSLYFCADDLSCRNKLACSGESFATLDDTGDCPVTAGPSWESYDYNNFEDLDLGDNLTFTCTVEAETIDYSKLPVVVVIGVTGTGKSTFCNYLSGYSEEHSSGYKSGTPVDGSSVTKTPIAKKVQWLGTGEEFFLIDTPGLGDPSGTAADREQFKEVIRFLKNEVKHINVLIHVVKGTDTRDLKHLKQNLRILKFMFGDSLKDNLVNEVTFWSHYDKPKEERDNFRHRKNLEHQKLFNDTNVSVTTFFIDPVDALPRNLKQVKLEQYDKTPGSWTTQLQELEALKTFIWNQQPFSCQETCDYAEELFGTRSPFPTIKSGDQYGAVRVTAGKVLQIDCLVAALLIESVNPRRISWYYNDTIIKTSAYDDIAITGGISDEFLYKATLTLPNTDTNATGIYSCAYRRHKAKIDLRVTVVQPINCTWTNYREWSECNKKCGNGTRFRTRDISQPALNGGAQCLGSPLQSESCNTQCCPQDCSWGSWGGWGSCSKTCGGGFKSRSRSKSQADSCGGKCDGSPTDTSECNRDKCPGDFHDMLRMYLIPIM